MKVDFAIIGDSAILNEQGVFSILNGGWEWLKATGFPATAQNLVLLTRLSFEASECGQPRTFQCKVNDPDGNELSPEISLVFSPLENPRNPARGNSFTIRCRYDGFTFRKEGDYNFGLFVDQARVGGITLEVIGESKS